MKKGEWFILKIGNDWGITYLAREPLTKDGFAKRGRAYRLEDGEEICVEMPRTDLQRRFGIVRLARHVESVGEHGSFHSNDVESWVPYVDFGDGSEAKLTNVSIQYDPERDPTAAEDP